MAKQSPLLIGIIGLFLGLGAHTVEAKVWISEFMASSDGGLNDEDGDDPDWVELYNDGVAAVDLDGWRLTDDISDPSKWVFPSVIIPAGGYLVVFASNKDRATAGSELHTNFKLSASGEYLGLYQSSGALEHDYANAYPQQITNIAYGVFQSGNVTNIVAQGAAGKAGVALSQADFTTNFNGWNSSINGSFTGSSWRNVNSGVGYEASAGYGTWLGTGGDFKTEMQSINASIFLRLPFTITNPASISGLTLRMRWDDGFVAYINGVQVAADRSPASPGWDSSATDNRPDALNDDWQNFTIDMSNVTLQAGDNLLAIHGLNDGVGSSDMLCLPELDMIGVVTNGNQLEYFTSSTPGSANSAGAVELPPLLHDVTDAVSPLPAGGAGSVPVTITALVTETLHATDTVTLFYRVMFNPESQVTMLDNGVSPDVLAGDGVFTANIPTTSMTSGEMLRWRVEVLDTENNLGQAPAYLDANDSDRYYGTIAAPAITTSNLSILHWFCENPASANTDGGTRASFFYLGQFYDNIQTDKHGQSSGFFTKKSYDIDFNKGNRFTWKEGEVRSKDINLLTNWADKTKLRNTLAYEIFRDSGATHSFAFPVRVQQNALFFSVADMVEDSDELYLERNGLDPEGALYKMNNRLESTADTTKKTRKQEDKSDLQALIDALNEGNSQDSRRLYGYDNIDIPATVNYLAGLVLAGSADQGIKNYYLYRDTNGTGDWMPIVWDVDLSLGHDWGSQGYFDDDLVWTQNLQLGNSNRLKTFIWNSPELNAMFVRRTRTLMDELLQLSTVLLAERRMENRINELVDLIDPTGVTSDADLDLTQWQSWRDGSYGVDSPLAGDAMRNQAQRLLNDYLPNRRAYLYGGTPSSNGLGIPLGQQVAPDITIEDVDYLPASNNQDEEYFILKNRESDAVDISGWQIKGAVEMTFKAGTVIPAGAGDAAAQFIGLLHVTKSTTAFRTRATGPTGGEYRFTQGGYSGQLSARGEIIELWDALGNLVATKTFVGSPSATQQFLRVTELNYHPADPSPSELTQIPSLTSSDFEFIELINTGSSSLVLDGAVFVEGIDYVFPASTTLAAGQRIVLAKNVAAFELRYGTGLNVIGDFAGQLNNAGERLKLLDSLGESILDFVWDDQWYPPSDGTGRTLALHDVSTPFNQLDEPESWGISALDHGSPGANNGVVLTHFEGWRYGRFNSIERADPQIGMVDSDDDNDGLTNWAEYCFGTNPRVPDAVTTNLISASFSSQEYAAISFPRRSNAFDIQWGMQSCEDLSSWLGETAILHGTPQPLGGGLEQAVLRSDTIISNGAPKFFRVEAGVSN